MPRLDRRLALAIAAGAAVLAVSIPALAVGPSPAANPDAAGEREKPGKPDWAGRPDKAPEVAVTLEGLVGEVADEQGRPTYTLTVGGETRTISAGPPWHWGEDNPLAAFVGETVTITGTAREGDPEVDVETLNGEPLREPGKPPWAGGPWVVGESHPGWKDWMADGKPGNGHGRDHAPGLQKQETPAP